MSAFGKQQNGIALGADGRSDECCLDILKSIKKSVQGSDYPWMELVGVLKEENVEMNRLAGLVRVNLLETGRATL